LKSQKRKRVHFFKKKKPGNSDAHHLFNEERFLNYLEENLIDVMNSISKLKDVLMIDDDSREN
jgi:hypothetical protein